MAILLDVNLSCVIWKNLNITIGLSFIKTDYIQ